MKNLKNFVALAGSVLFLLVFTMTPAEAQTCVNPPSNLVSWWPLDETSGTTAADIIGANDGTHFNGPTPAPGKVAGALSFDGTGDRVDISNPDNFNFLTWTYTFWFKSTQGPFPNLIGRQFANGKGWTVHFTSLGGSGSFAIRIDTDTGINQVKHISPANDGQFHFAAVVMDDNTKTVKLSLDGGTPTSFSYSGNFNPSGGFLTLAGLAVGGSLYNGLLDEVSIYNRALTPTEIQAEFNANSAGKCKQAPDSDGDGVADGSDLCSGTAIPESVPTIKLGVNRWALFDGDLAFDTTPPKGKGPNRSYNITQTGGCSCEQIIAAQGLGKGHTKFGCSISAMDDWVALVNPGKRGDGADAAEVASVPEAFVLEANYPNPFNPQTTIRFSMSESAYVTLVVYDVLGREVRVLLDGTREAGTHEVVFEASALPSGTYLVRLVTPAGSFVQTMQLMK